jgi:hypothetical protein
LNTVRTYQLTSLEYDQSVPGKKHFNVVFFVTKRTGCIFRAFDSIETSFVGSLEKSSLSFRCLAFGFKVNRRHSTGVQINLPLLSTLSVNSRDTAIRTFHAIIFVIQPLIASIYGRGSLRRIVVVPIRHAYTSRTRPSQLAFVAWQVSHIPMSVISNMEQRTENVLIDRLCRNQQRLTVAFVE